MPQRDCGMVPARFGFSNRSKYSSDVRAAMALGIVDSSLLLLIPNVVRDVSKQISDGIDPVRLLAHKVKTVNSDRLPKLLGMEPLSVFLESSSDFSCVNNPSSVGIVPEIPRFSERSSTVNKERLPSSVGMVPSRNGESELTFKLVSLEKSPSSEGRVPRPLKK